MARVMPAPTGTAPATGPGGKRALRILDRGSRQLVLLLATAIALVPVYVMITGAFKTQAEFLASPWSLPAAGRSGTSVSRSAMASAAGCSTA